MDEKKSSFWKKDLWQPPGFIGYKIGSVIIAPVSYTHLDVYKRQAYI